MNLDELQLTSDRKRLLLLASMSQDVEPIGDGAGAFSLKSLVKLVGERRINPLCTRLWAILSSA